MADTDDATVNTRPNPNEKLVKVFDTEQESEALVVKGLLDSAGIDNDITAAAMVQEMFPGIGGTILLVREEDAERARSLIAESRQPDVSDGDETAEIDAMEIEAAGEPPAQA